MRRNRATHNSSANRLMLLGLVAVPVLVLASGIVLNTSGPAIARAGNPLEQEQAPELRPLSDRPLPQDIAERTEAIAKLPLPNPLYYPAKRKFAPVTPKDDPKPTDPQPEPELKLPGRCVVTGILRGRDGTVRAVIDGAMYASGDELAPGWTVIGIDTALRTVELRQPNGKTRIIQMNSD